ncbi:hypothetical protein HPB50_008345 [Hyalomma asiaticum]|uniref:Uncharacterized protein n=1 Tax=Hyalomma asiaticum TaxID=266040 RepID=A0ACB7SYR8_HYAAI|nr:hypothetical protein HPB50_008345 [Hyalomma asiaticum]
MITAAACRCLPPVQTACTVAPKEHAPSFNHYPNQITVPLVLASPEERRWTPDYWMLQPSADSMHRGPNGAWASVATLRLNWMRSSHRGSRNIERDTVKAVIYKGAADCRHLSGGSVAAPQTLTF